MGSMTRPRAKILVVLLLAVTVAGAAAGLWFDHLERQAGRPDLTGFADYTWLFLVAVAAASAVGAVIAVNQPRHPVGWLFLVLAAALMLAGPIDGYAAYALIGSPDRPLAGGAAAAFLADREWIAWFAAGRDDPLPHARWSVPVAALAVVGRGTAVAGVLALLLSIPTVQRFDAPFEDVENPFAVPALQPGLDVVKAVLVYVLGVGLIAAARLTVPPLPPGAR